MNKIISTFVLALALVLTACGSKSGFDFDEADKLVKKINAYEQFSQDDYAKAIELINVGNEYAFDLLDKVDFQNDTPEDMAKLGDEEEMQKMQTAVMTITTYLYSHRGDLDEKNQKAMEEVEKLARDRALELQKKVLGK